MPSANPLPAALLRADLWRVLALAFSAPTKDSLDDLEALCHDLAAALPPDDAAFCEGLKELGRHAAAANPSALEHEHDALFSRDVQVSAYEGGYQRIERGSVVGDIAGFYKAFGLDTTDHSGPPDSIWNELAFLAWLSLKESYAIERNMAEALTVTREATGRFLEDHLGRWAGAFVHRLLNATANPLYVTAAHLLLAAVSRAANELCVEEITPLEADTPPVVRHNSSGGTEACSGVRAPHGSLADLPSGGERRAPARPQR